MHQFASGALGSDDRQVMEHARSEHANEYTLSNTTYWMEHELRQYPRVELNLTKLSPAAERIVLAGGRDAQDYVAYQPNRVLARLLDCEIVDFPGGHLGLLAFHAEFAQVLIDALKDE
jgi:hypothetical protein